MRYILFYFQNDSIMLVYSTSKTHFVSFLDFIAYFYLYVFRTSFAMLLFFDGSDVVRSCGWF